MQFKLFIVIIVCCFSVVAQQTSNSAAAPAKSEQASQPPSEDYLQKAAQTSIFIYDGGTQPCEGQPTDSTLLPLGSGFVAGITSKAATPDKWKGWKLLVTAAHVLHQSSGKIVVRLNRSDGSGFACLPIPLFYDGSQKNVFLLKDEEAADIAAVPLPDIPGTAPTIFGMSMLLDPDSMAKGDIKVGTNVFTVGYFYGFGTET
jgi:hypothetical protein